jgi:hypothetical protein
LLCDTRGTLEDTVHLPAALLPLLWLQRVCNVLVNRDYLTFSWISRPESVLTID